MQNLNTGVYTKYFIDSFNQPIDGIKDVIFIFLFHLCYIV